MLGLYCYVNQVMVRFFIFIFIFLSYTLAWCAATSSAKSPTKPALDTICGVTIDTVENLPATVASLKSLKCKPTTRIVFDENINASHYANAAEQIHKVSSIMGELLDSFYAKNISVKDYATRTKEYLNVLGNNVDIWEIGNEINGEWLGETAQVVEKMNAAYNIVKARQKTTALTLYYNDGCWAKKSNEMFTWAQANISETMKQGLDYVFISYYEDDCNDLQPDWPKVFQKLATMFPNSKIGFGEVGTKHPDRKKAYINRYYNMKIDHPRFVGGYFWWYFSQDMVPSTKPLLKMLNNALISNKKGQ